jgi:hypothetical protein
MTFYIYIYNINRWQNAAKGKWNSTWESLGGKWPDNSHPVVVVNTDGGIEVFIVGNDKVLYHRWQTKPAGSWV